MQRAVVLLAAVAVAYACGQAPADRLAEDTTRPVASTDSPTPRPPVPQSLGSPGPPGPIATRHEAQRSFDRARAALIRKDYAACARHLTAASRFMRAHAAEAELGAIAALQGAAKELEFVAERLSKGDVVTVRTLDRVVANANRAEAQHHLTRAVAALAERDSRSAGEELLMSVDHMERTAMDLRQAYDPDSTHALLEARTVASRLVRGETVPRAETGHVIDQLAAELRRLCAIIDVEARACGIEAGR